jgi:hypothetical protein
MAQEASLLMGMGDVEDELAAADRIIDVRGDAESAHSARFPSAGAAAEQCVVVLGMHRSGTSAVAGTLCAAGAWAGSTEQLLPPQPDNPRGYFERADTASSLDALLEQLGGQWWCPPVEELQAWRLEQTRPVLRDILDTVIETAPAGTLPLIKDPRLALFTSELTSLLATSWPIVVAVRHPLEVARSLHDRDGLPIPIGLALWEVYNAMICSGLAGRAVHVVRYDRLLEDRQALEAFLGRVIGGGEPLPSHLLSRAAIHLEISLRHQHATVTDEDRWLTVSCLRLWHKLDEESRADRATVLPPSEPSYTALQQLRLHAQWRLDAVTENEAAARAGASDARLAEAHEGQLVLQQQLQDALAERTGLADIVAALQAENSELGADAAEFVEERKRLVEEVTCVTEQLERREAELGASVEAREDLQEQMVALTEARDRLVEERARFVEEFSRLTVLLEQREAELAAGVEARNALEQHAATLAEDRDRLVEERSGVEAKFREACEERTHAFRGWADAERAHIQAVADTRSAEALHREQELDLTRQLTELSRQLVEARAELTAKGRQVQESEAEVAWLHSELAAVNEHRQVLVDDINAICTSESWRLGHALTWPARKLSREPS